MCFCFYDRNETIFPLYLQLKTVIIVIVRDRSVPENVFLRTLFAAVDVKFNGK
jgi:hypothetical protein